MMFTILLHELLFRSTVANQTENSRDIITKNRNATTTTIFKNVYELNVVRCDSILVVIIQ